MPVSLTGQVAIVTGAATGIGSGMAIELAARGAKVCVNYRSQPDEAKDVLEKIKAAGGTAIGVGADVSKPEDVQAMVAETIKYFGRLDIMIANAGVQIDAPALEMTPEQWDKAMGVDLKGVFLCAQAAARQFIAQGIDPAISKAAGKVLVTLSVHDKVPWMGHANYAAAKGGAHMLMQTLAQEWAQHRIRVLGVSPGAIRTPINKTVWEGKESYENLMKLIPYGRIGEIEDIARTAAFLVSDEADYITGTTLYVDGGMTLYPDFIGNG